MDSDTLPRVQHLGRRLTAATNGLGASWQDASAARIRKRHLAPMHQHGARMATALSEQVQHHKTAASAIDEANRLAEACRRALEAASEESERLATQVQAAVEHIDSGLTLRGQSDTLLQEALDALGRAGAGCGEARGSAAIASVADPQPDPMNTQADVIRSVAIQMATILAAFAAERTLHLEGLTEATIHNYASLSDPAVRKAGKMMLVENLRELRNKFGR